MWPELSICKSASGRATDFQKNQGGENGFQFTAGLSVQLGLALRLDPVRGRDVCVGREDLRQSLRAKTAGAERRQGAGQELTGAAEARLVSPALRQSPALRFSIT